MKLRGIGDLFIPKQYFETGMESLNLDIATIDWDTTNITELQRINLLVEKGGSEAYVVPDYILDFVKDAEILITQFCPVNKKVIDNCPNLNVIGVLRAGIENINLEYATEKGILVMNTPGRNADSVADFAVGAIISENRNIARGHHGLKQGKWLKEFPNSDNIPDLPGKTAGIIGFGDVGKKVAKRLRGFDMRILVFDPFVKDAPEGVELVDLKNLMAQSDFITVHARLTPESRHVVNAEMLALMKPTAYIINTARSGLIDENALCDVLKNKRIAGAFLDVFENEPLETSDPLFSLENLTFTPHMAGGSTDAFRNSPQKLAVELRNVLNNNKSRFVLNEKVRGNIKWT
jgi:D-3-phosphoglycerate dehydrogenase